MTSQYWPNISRQDIAIANYCQWKPNIEPMWLDKRTPTPISPMRHQRWANGEGVQNVTTLCNVFGTFYLYAAGFGYYWCIVYLIDNVQYMFGENFAAGFGYYRCTVCLIILICQLVGLCSWLRSIVLIMCNTFG